MSNKLYFVDLSNNNEGAIDFKAYAAVGHKGVVLKASQGVGFTDPTYTERYHEAMAAGLWVGAYCFADHTGSAAANASRFEEAIHGTSPRFRILDAEQGGNLVAPEEFCVEFQHATHTDWLYSDLGYLEGLDKAVLVGACKVWAAAFPNLTAGWWMEHLAAHQYADNARVKGIPGTCDISVLHV